MPKKEPWVRKLWTFSIITRKKTTQTSLNRLKSQLGLWSVSFCFLAYIISFRSQTNAKSTFSNLITEIFIFIRMFTCLFVICHLCVQNGGMAMWKKWEWQWVQTKKENYWEIIKKPASKVHKLCIYGWLVMLGHRWYMWRCAVADIWCTTLLLFFSCYVIYFWKKPDNKNGGQLISYRPASVSMLCITFFHIPCPLFEHCTQSDIVLLKHSTQTPQ